MYILFVFPVLLLALKTCSPDATLLHLAVSEGQSQIAKYLIVSKSADTSVKDRFGNTPLAVLRLRQGRMPQAEYARLERVLMKGEKEADK